ncbi:Uncharacterised protein [Escherichia coli]|nr:Uncharacterised protein [Escherichia coli]
MGAILINVSINHKLQANDAAVLKFKHYLFKVEA